MKAAIIAIAGAMEKTPPKVFSVANVVFSHVAFGYRQSI
jgi:hypothetical protein